MTDEEIRLECLRLAIANMYDPEDAADTVAKAMLFADFVFGDLNEFERHLKTTSDTLENEA